MIAEVVGTSDATTMDEVRDQLRAGSTTSAELVAAALARADADDARLGVFVSRFPERALEAAHDIDDRRASGGDVGMLGGIPAGIKDIVATADGPTTGQSLVHDQGWVDGDAEVVARLRRAGAIVVGKTTTMEFALGAPDPEKPFPLPRNPWDDRRWAGGSSSGSASGVAAGMFLGAVGTDTGASVRMPAALCGITGLKPTLGRVPKSGIIPLGYSLDCVGPMAPSARDCAVMLSVMAGASPEDPFTQPAPVPDYLSLLDRDLTGLRIGVDTLSRFHDRTADPACATLLAEVVRELEHAGATVVEVELPLYRELTAAAVVSILSEAFAHHAPDVRARWSDYFASTRLALAASAFVSGGDYVQAQRVRRHGRSLVRKLLEGVDVLLTPTVSRPAPALEDAGAYTATLFEADQYAYHTAYWNALGNPALTMPMGFTADGLPMGAQLVGNFFDEATVLRVADAFQARTSHHLRRPGPAPASYPLDPGVAPKATAPGPDSVAFARALLELNGLTPAPEEIEVLVGFQGMVRCNVELVYGVADARYEVPGTNLSAELPYS